MTSCAKTKESEQPSAHSVKFSLQKLDSPIIYESPQDAKTACNLYLGLVKQFRSDILAVEGTRTVQNTLEPMNELHIAFGRLLGINELMNYTHPDATVRQAAEDCQKEAMAAMTAINMDKELYYAIKAVDVAGLDKATKRFVELTLRDYERAGVNKDENTRKRIAELDAAMVESSMNFGRNIRDSKPTLKVSPQDLAGLPEDFIHAKPLDENGMVTLTTDYTDYFPVLNYAKSEKLRRDLTKLFNDRAYPANEEVLKNYLKQRQEFASLLGYKNWAAYITADKMSKNPETVTKFIEDVVKISRPRMEKDIKEAMDKKRVESPAADAFYAWDRFYFTEQIKQEKYEVNAQELRQYFPYEQVKKGVLSTASQIYGITFQQIDAPVWHDSVEAYEIYQGSQRIAQFYLDMHPREGKYGHAAMFGLLNHIDGLQTPAASLVCNFPEPSQDNPAFMEHSDVVTFFHEFGHLMHQLLSSPHVWTNQSGISCEWDFVETPSQLFEEWAWDYDVLKHFAVNPQGEVIGKDVVERMKKAERVGLGVHVMRQMYYAALSFQFHNRDPQGLDPSALAEEVHAKYSPFAFVPGDKSYTSFGHLDGYSAIYYTYMWSLAIEKDIFQRFKDKGIMNTEVARDYRNTILSVGGGKDADEMLKDFLGRPYKLDAFKKWLSE